MIHRLLSPVDPALYTDLSGIAADAPTLRMRYLGTAGFVFSHNQHTIVVDPYLSRPGVLQTAFGRLVPDEALLARCLPHADDVLVGHAHHDHVLDAPALCARTGARFIGSPDACNVARAAGLPADQLVETRGRTRIPSGPGAVRGLPSRHGRVYFGRVTLPGTIPAPPPWPPRVFDLRHGLVLNWVIELGGLTVVHVDSADFIDQELEGTKADVACLCAIGRASRPGFVRRAIELLQPRYVVACHWDLFTTPWGAPPRLLPGVDLPGFRDEVRAAGATPVILPFDGELGLAPEGPPPPSSPGAAHPSL